MCSIGIFTYWILDYIFVASIIVLHVYFKITSAYSFWERKEIKYIKPITPFGNVRDIILKKKTVAETFRDLYEYYPDEPFVGIYELFTPILFVRDVELAKCMLVKDFGYFQDRGFEFDEELDPLCNHLIYVNGYTWRFLRTKLTPTFTSGKMRMMINLISECANTVKNHLEAPAKIEEVIEINEIMSTFTIDVIGSCAFGININALNEPNSQFREMGRRVLEPTLLNALRRTMKYVTPKLAMFLRIKGMSDDISNFFINLTKEMMEYREKNKVVRNDFLHLLIQLKKHGKIIDDDNNNERNTSKDPESETCNEATDKDVELTDQLLAAQLFVFFLAGFETSSITLTFCLYELAVNPEVQTKLQEEIDSTLEECGGNITYEAVQKMSYLSKVIDETLRLYPPISSLVRVATKPYVVPGTNLRLDVGQKVIVPLCAIHYDPKYYPDPRRFDPERFNEEVKATRPNNTYMPFGLGPRNCIGYRFGELETKLGLITLLSKYEFCVSEKTVVPVEFDPNHMFIFPRGGLWLRIKNRN